MDIIGRRRVGLIAAFALLGLTVVAGSTGAFAIGPDPATERVSPPPAPSSTQTDQGTKKKPHKSAKKSENGMDQSLLGGPRADSEGGL